MTNWDKKYNYKLRQITIDQFEIENNYHNKNVRINQ